MKKKDVKCRMGSNSFLSQPEATGMKVLLRTSVYFLKLPSTVAVNKIKYVLYY